MKRTVLYSILLLLAIYAATSAATHPTIFQLAGLQTPAGAVTIVMPTGQVTQATLGPGIAIDTSTSPPTFRVAVPSTQTKVATTKVLVSTSTPTVTVPTSCAVMQQVFWNGILMSSPDDYTAGSGSITFSAAAGVPGAGDIIQSVCYN